MESSSMTLELHFFNYMINMTKLPTVTWIFKCPRINVFARTEVLERSI